MEADGIEEIDHTADWSLRVRGRDLAELCQRAAVGMLRLAGAVANATADRQSLVVSFSAPDREVLLVRWLEGILYDLETHGRIPVRMDVQVGPALDFHASLEVAPLASLGRAIKAVTFHGLQVREIPEGLEATLVFDV